MRALRAAWSAALVIHPLFGVVGLIVGWLRTGIRRSFSQRRATPWLVVWAPLLGLGLVRAALGGEASGWLFLHAAGALVLSVLLSSEKSPRWLPMLAGLLALIVFNLVELRVNEDLWSSNSRLVISSGAPAARLESLAGIQGEPIHAYFAQGWSDVASDADHLLTLEYRLASGIVGWEWYRYNPAFVLTPHVDGAGRAVTQVLPPAADARSRYISREINTGSSLGGRRFRASVEIRTEEVSGSDPCRGVILQENGGGYHGECLPVSGGTDFSRYELEFRAPMDARSTGIRLVIADLQRSFEVRGGTIEEFIDGEWIDLGPPQPVGIGVWPPLGGARRHDTFSARALPSADWQELAMLVPAGTALSNGNLTLTLQVEGGATVDVRNVHLSPLSEDVAKPTPIARQRTHLWHGQPNLAGHSIAAAGLLVMSRAPGAGGMIISFLAAFIAVSFSGSRTALVALGVGAVLLLLSRRPWASSPGPRSRRARAAIGVGALLVAAVVVLAFGPSQLLGRLNPTSEGFFGLTSRTEIWQVALDMLERNPLLGVSDVGGFAANWQRFYSGGSTELVAHAHNFWLQLGAEFGVPGLVASLLTSIGLLWLAWASARWRGVAVVVPFLLLQVLDFTFFYLGVLFPLVLALSLLRVPVRTARKLGSTFETGSDGQGDA